jgi:succinoglycan biosynthesis protein ExoM
MSETTVSVCVATKDRVDLLDACLTSILKQELTEHVRLVELCVLDNSTDGSASDLVGRISGSESRIEVRYEHFPGGGYSTARNALLEMVSPTCDFFAFVDDDEVVEPDWLDRLVGYAIDEGLEIVAGPVEAVAPSGELPRWFVRREHLRLRPEPVPNGIVPAGNLLVSARAWRRAGMMRFDTSFDSIGGEDTDWIERLLECGLSTGYCAAAKAREVWSGERLTKHYWRRRAFRSGQVRWLQMAKRGSDASDVVLFVRAVGGHGFPRIASGFFQLIPAVITGDYPGRWRAEARIMRGLGVLFEGFRGLRRRGRNERGSS